MQKSTLKKKTDRIIKNNAILLFICSRLLSCLSIVINRILFIYGNDKYIFQMLEIYRCDNCTCFCQIVGFCSISLTYPINSPSTYFSLIFEVTMRSPTVTLLFWSYSCVKRSLPFIDQFQISFHHTVILCTDSHGTDIAAVIDNGTYSRPVSSYLCHDTDQTFICKYIIIHTNAVYCSPG